MPVIDVCQREALKSLLRLVKSTTHIVHPMAVGTTPHWEVELARHISCLGTILDAIVGFASGYGFGFASGYGFGFASGYGLGSRPVMAFGSRLVVTLGWL